MVEVGIGARVREAMVGALPAASQAEVAQQVDMAPDAFSRSLNGKRTFSSIELVRLADLLEVDVHWLITGVDDPHRLVFAARHRFVFGTGARDVPGRDGDAIVLRDVGLAYRQVSGLPASAPMPRTPDGVRDALDDDFVRPFASRVEERLGVDVVRLAGLSTAYCFTYDGRRVIVVPAVGNWFRENWDIAHELGHLAAGHLAGSEPSPEHEAAANAFAAELLLPAARLRALDWQSIADAELAQRVWELGVSTDALARRLAGLRLVTSRVVDLWAQQPTQRLLRRHWSRATVGGGDAITRRMADAAARRFPLALQNAHLAAIASGELGKDTLAWMLGVPVESLDVDSPPPSEPDVDSLANALGLTPAS